MAGKSNTLKIKKLQINFTDRWLYTLIVFFSLVIIGVFVYAQIPNPGHAITEIEAPAVCNADQFLQWTGSAWACADAAAGAETDPVWTGESANVAFINQANTFSAFNQSFDTNTLFVDATNDRIGINKINPIYELDVDGYVNAIGFMGDGSALTDLVPRVTETDVCNETTHGVLRYISGMCSGDDIRTSSFHICMRVGDTSYGWYFLGENSWTDIVCDQDGCPVGEDWYECEGIEGCAQPGCYPNKPDQCYFFECFNW
jgi:hypothetical protein